MTMWAKTVTPLLLTILLLLLVALTRSSEEALCDEGEFYCGPDDCIDDAWLCDMEEDCSENNRDEDFEMCQERSCDDESFRCDSGQCISSEYECDGDMDCEDESDESVSYCADEGAVSCGSHQMACSQSYGCVVLQYVCDGDPDCPQGEDEKNCDGEGEVSVEVEESEEVTPEKCQPKDGEAVCPLEGGRSRCIRVSALCDGFNDCFEGADEKNCDNHTPSTTISTTTTRKRNGENRNDENVDPKGSIHAADNRGDDSEKRPHTDVTVDTTKAVKATVKVTTNGTPRKSEHVGENGCESCWQPTSTVMMITLAVFTRLIHLC